MKSNRKKILVIDDCRELNFAHVLCRTVDDGINALKTMGPFVELHLDHDMCAVEHQYHDTGREKTGYDVLVFLEENPEFIPERIVIVTQNASARPKMEALVKRLLAARTLTNKGENK